MQAHRDGNGRGKVKTDWVDFIYRHTVLDVIKIRSKASSQLLYYNKHTFQKSSI